MNFPDHLHDDVEVLHCLKAESRFLSWEKPTWSGKGECAVIFPERVHSYRSDDNSAGRCCLFSSTAISGTVWEDYPEDYPENPFLKRKIFAGCEAGIQARLAAGWPEG